MMKCNGVKAASPGYSPSVRMHFCAQDGELNAMVCIKVSADPKESRKYPSTCERNKVPNAVRIVSVDHVAQIEEHMLVQSPILVAVAIVVVVGYGLAPDT